MAEKLTTTAYAILGHLAMQPWTMYELAGQMRRNVHFFYPRAESQVYAEPRKLVALGLASLETVAVGRRKRTIYAITPAGRRALSEWMSGRVSKGPLLEFEGLLRVFLAPFGSNDDLRSTLQQVREEIGGLLQMSVLIRDEYLAGRAPFQRYAPTRAMIHDFLTHFGILVESWAARSLRILGRWETMTETERHSVALGAFRRNVVDRQPGSAAADRSVKGSKPVERRSSNGRKRPQPSKR